RAALYEPLRSEPQITSTSSCFSATSHPPCFDKRRQSRRRGKQQTHHVSLGQGKVSGPQAEAPPEAASRSTASRRWPTCQLKFDGVEDAPMAGAALSVCDAAR